MSVWRVKQVYEPGGGEPKTYIGFDSRDGIFWVRAIPDRDFARLIEGPTMMGQHPDSIVEKLVLQVQEATRRVSDSAGQG